MKSNLISEEEYYGEGTWFCEKWVDTSRSVVTVKNVHCTVISKLVMQSVTEVCTNVCTGLMEDDSSERREV